MHICICIHVMCARCDIPAYLRNDIDAIPCDFPATHHTTDPNQSYSPTTHPYSEKVDRFNCGVTVVTSENQAFEQGVTDQGWVEGLFDILMRGTVVVLSCQLERV